MWWHPAIVQYRRIGSSVLQDVNEIIRFTFDMLDQAILRFRHDPLVGIGILYLAIKSQEINRSGTKKSLMVVYQLIMKFENDTGNEYILSISEHKSTNFPSTALSTWSM
jgi:hypothetical protein